MPEAWVDCFVSMLCHLYELRTMMSAMACLKLEEVRKQTV